MKWPIDQTHDPNLTSWVESGAFDSAFPIQNLPYCVFIPPDGETARIGVAIGDQILDLRSCIRAGLIVEPALTSNSLNHLMGLSVRARAALRARISELLSDNSWRAPVESLLVPLEKAELQMPADIGDYTDFYASLFHAMNVGKLFRPDNPLLPNYKYVPIGYHGRSSSIVLSGTAIKRPSGQFKAPDADVPVFGPTRSLDYEMEGGFFVGRGNELGNPIAIADAQSHLFGMCLLNDWSARDIQSWEYQPLGPFLGKSFATSISPWVITMEALAPYRVPAFERDSGDPETLSYLSSEDEAQQGGIEATLEVWLSSTAMRAAGTKPMRVSESSLRNLYWTPGQMIAHHTSNGCNLNSGDLLGTGTVSGPGTHERGCLLEITQRGAQPLQLPDGETRVFLADGDEVIMRGYCSREGFATIGLGECRGIVSSLQ